jgi:hypothetical protein
MTGQRWRTYALLLQIFATYTAIDWLLDHTSEPWGFVTTVFLLGFSLLGLIVPVTTDRTVGRHRIEE